jgi:hypothetical protein
MRLADHPVLAPTERSGLQAVTNGWLLQHRVDADLMLSSNSLSALTITTSKATRSRGLPDPRS